MRQRGDFALRERRLDVSEDSGIRREAFETATLATVAFGAVRVDGDMTEFTDAARHALIELMMDDHAHADPAPNRRHDEVRLVATFTEQLLGQREGVHVIFSVHGDINAEAALDHLPQRHITPAEKR